MKEAIEPCASLLPDMDLVFNLHDEPRVVIPHDDLTYLLARAHTVRESMVFGNSPSLEHKYGFFNKAKHATASP